MKLLTIILVVLISGSCVTQKTYIKKFNNREKMFIRNAIRIANETPTSVLKRRADSYIVLEFPTQIWVLTPTGYVDRLLELHDGEWIDYGLEKDAY
jgi:hypothetical protein